MRGFRFNAQNPLIGFPEKSIEKLGAVALQGTAVDRALLGQFPRGGGRRDFHNHRSDDPVGAASAAGSNLHEPILENGAQCSVRS